MEKLITITLLAPSDKEQIAQIARWYEEEWGTPAEINIQRLSTHPNQDIIFHLKLSINGEVVAAGGLWNTVNIFNFHENLKQYRPWIAALYTLESFRGRGLGSLVLEHIEQRALELGLEKIYLYTFTAQDLYRKHGWVKIDTVEYKGHATVVMEKQL
ncbi:MAG: GNAT family N-acetyltransferase [Bacteroidetes bacterium]|nr:MAG: GNAT family N-acetyltransferase [Bacteroidota bacterium]